MKFTGKWITAVAVVLAAGALCAGVAMADGGRGAAKLDEAVKAGKLTQGQADVMLQIQGARAAARTKMQADAKALVDQAVQSGKITKVQGDELLKRLEHGHRGPWDGKGGHDFRGAKTPAELKAKLDAAVKAGKLTPEQADKMLQRFTEHQNKAQ